MGILNKLLSNYGDDLAEAAGKTAANYTDDFVSRWGNQIAEAGANKSDDAMRALLNKRGNKDMVRDAFMAMQPDIPGKDLSSMFRAYGGDKPAGRKMLSELLTDEAGDIPSLVGYHSVGTDKLKMAIDDLGGDIVNPSLQIVDPAVNAGKSYGDVILLGDKDMYFDKGDYGVLDTWGKSNAYSRDIYSPRMPKSVEKNGEKFIEGTRKPYTAQNISDYMNKQGKKAVESTWATPAQAAAATAERANKLSDLLEWAKEGKIGKQVDNEKAFDDFNKYVSDRIFDYADKNGYLKDSYNSFMVNDEILTDVQNLLNGKRIGDDFYNLYGPEGRELVRDISRAAYNLPTDYFEVKATRPLGLGEFSGAILPNDYADEQVLKALEEAGVPIMGNYDPSNYDESLRQTLQEITKGKNRFQTPYMLGAAGLLGGGSILGALLSGGNDNTQNRA